jgi:hypothetical protein
MPMDPSVTPTDPNTVGTTTPPAGPTIPPGLHGRAFGQKISEQARLYGREFGQYVSEQARNGGTPFESGRDRRNYQPPPVVTNPTAPGAPALPGDPAQPIPAPEPGVVAPVSDTPLLLPPTETTVE